MVYYSDLSKYEYIPSNAKNNLVNIGWLDGEHAYTRGKVSDAVLLKVFELCKVPVNETRGYHVCELCHDKHFGITVEVTGDRLVLGGAEIRVNGCDGRIYAAPDLIYHYMREHDYLPPEEFVLAVTDS